MSVRGGNGVEIVGRDRELAVAHSFVTGRWPAALCVVGAAGIGKSALWSSTIDQLVRLGVDAWVVRAAEAEHGVAFAALDMLLAPRQSLLDRIDPQRAETLLAVLGEVPAGHRALDVRTIGSAMANLLTVASDGHPLLLAFDDEQWIDPASAEVLAFALRRVHDRPIGVVTARRTGGPATRAGLAEALAPDTTSQLDLGPLPVGVIARILRERLDLRPARSQLTRLHELSGGNPLTALELGRAVRDGGSLGDVTAQSELIQRRVAGLLPDVRLLIALVGAVGEPSLALVERVLGDAAAEAVAGAVAAEAVVVDDGALRATHPVLASAGLAILPPRDRRALHARIADSVDTPELAAVHRALSTDSPDEAVAAALERAANGRARQGATPRAAELMRMAADLTPTDGATEQHRRRRLEARLLLQAGEITDAVALLGRLEAEATGADLVEVLLLRADTAAAGDDRVGARAAGVAALEVAGDDRRLAARCHATISVSTPLGVEDELDHARRVLDLVTAEEEPAAVTQALTTIIHADLALGNGVDDRLVEQALGLDDASIRWIDRPRSSLVSVPRTAGDLSTARQMQLAAIDAARAEGEESALPFQLAQLAAIELREGDVAAAEARLTEAEELAAALELELPAVVVYRAQVAALAGRLDEAASVAAPERARRIAAGDAWGAILLGRTLVLAAVQRGESSAAARVAGEIRAAAASFGVHEPAYFAVDTDLVESLVAMGDLAAARTVVADLDAVAARGRLPWTVLAAARGRLLVAAADTDEAGLHDLIAAIDDALGGVTSRYEKARSHLAMGRVLQRRGRRRDARERLTVARDLFDELGTIGFRLLADRELGRLGGRQAVGLSLTAGERQVAELAAQGLSNREIAEQLYLSVRTVESHLSAVYRKLGVSSRRSLIRLMAGGSP